MTDRQFTLDDAIAAQARELAISAAARHADTDWATAALDAVKQVAQRHAEFTTDAVLEILATLPVKTPELRALGPVMRDAAARGWCSRTDRVVNSSSVSRHRAPKSVWVSHILHNR